MYYFFFFIFLFSNSFSFSINPENGENVFWFVQISDVHIRLDDNGESTQLFSDFLHQILPIIKPSFILCTGDMTTGQNGSLVSEPIEKEWQIYYQTLQKYNYAKPDFWYDVKGNHDCVSGKTFSNLYSKYSVSGRFNRSGVYDFSFKTSNGLYHFIGFDSADENCPGMKYSSFGYVNKEKLDKIEKLINNGIEYNHSIIFTHHPLSMIDQNVFSSSNKSLEEIILENNISVYLCGHLHGGLPIVGDKSPHLDLSTDCFMNQIRIFSIDNDRISFSDYNVIDFIEKPIVLITNPKNCIYEYENKSHLSLSEKDQYIRFIVFHTLNTEVDSISVLIDSKQLNERINVKDKNIYSIRYDASKFIYGVHELSIKVRLSNGQCNYFKRKFSFSSICPDSNNSFLSKYFISVNWSKTPYYSFIIIYITVILMLVLILISNYRLYSFNKMKFWSTPKTIQICLENTSLYSIYPSLLPLSNINYVSELIEFIFKRSIYFIHLWDCRIYILYFILSPLLPISFHNFHSDMFYIYTLFGAYYPYKNMLLYPMDAKITYFIIMVSLWLPMLKYIILFSNGNEMLYSIKSKFVKFTLYLLKYGLLIIMILSIFMFGIVWTSMDYPESLTSPVVLNCMFVVFHKVFYG